MSTNRVQVTAVIPTYNCAHFLPRAIASIRQQTLAVREILVVDDGSTDDTPAVVRSLGADIRLLSQANAGPSAARNRGVAAASSELIAFLDADDEWMPDAIAELTGAILRHPSVALVSADKCVIDAAGRVLHESWFRRQNVAGSISDAAGRPIRNAIAELLKHNYVNTSVALVRADAVRAAGGFREDIRYGEDLELWLRIASRHDIVVLPQILGRYRSHGTNLTNATEPMLRDLVRVGEAVRGWGRAILKTHGVDADEVVARALTDLGYWYFSAGRHREARTALLRAIREHPSWRAWRYLVLSCFPAGAVQRLRRMKASLQG